MSNDDLFDALGYLPDWEKVNDSGPWEIEPIKQDDIENVQKNTLFSVWPS